MDRDFSEPARLMIIIEMAFNLIYKILNDTDFNSQYFSLLKIIENYKYLI